MVTSRNLTGDCQALVLRNMLTDHNDGHIKVIVATCQTSSNFSLFINNQHFQTEFTVTTANVLRPAGHRPTENHLQASEKCNVSFVASYSDITHTMQSP